MRRRDPRTRCIKRKVSKSKEVLKAYDKVQNAYADKLDADDNVISFICNVPIDDNSIGEFATDYLITKTDGSIAVRECVLRTNLLRPRTVKLLDFSQRYWLKKGVTDWKVVVDAEKK